jgi:hypothetical protein
MGVEFLGDRLIGGRLSVWQLPPKLLLTKPLQPYHLHTAIKEVLVIDY